MSLKYEPASEPLHISAAFRTNLPSGMGDWGSGFMVRSLGFGVVRGGRFLCLHHCQEFIVFIAVKTVQVGVGRRAGLGKQDSARVYPRILVYLVIYDSG